MLQRFPLLEAASLKAIPFFRQCCSLGFVLSLYGLCCWHHLSICATNSSKIAEIKLILFLRLFSEFPGDFLVTLWEWREKRQGITRYIHIYGIYPYRCTPVSLRQVVSIRKLETWLCPHISWISNACSAQKEGFSPLPAEPDSTTCTAGAGELLVRSRQGKQWWGCW